MIEVERRVATAISEAEAARVISEAQSQAGSRAVAQDAATDAVLRDLQSSLERERSEPLAEIARQSDEAARCHLDVDEARVRALSERVATRIAEGDLASDEPGP